MEIGVESWKLPPRESYCQRFPAVSSIENNHVYISVHPLVNNFQACK